MHTDDGAPRRVGVEIEFADIELDAAAAIVVAAYGGSTHWETDYELSIETDDLGKFRIEFDASLIKRMGQERAHARTEPGAFEQFSEDLVAGAARQFLPYEIITPPLPWQRVVELDELAAALRQAGARGTDDSWIYAFGVHFNPQAPSLTVVSLLAYLRAFVLLYDWLVKRIDVDFARRVSPFIKPYAREYVYLLLNADYAPSREQLIDDYLSYNPSRNHALDMLPLFAYLDNERVQAAVGDARVNPRPTYHYRLANSRIGDAAWRLSEEWGHWLQVEALASDPDRLADMAVQYRQLLDRPLGDLFSAWAQQTEQWLDTTLR